MSYFCLNISKYCRCFVPKPDVSDDRTHRVRVFVGLAFGMQCQRVPLVSGSFWYVLNLFSTKRLLLTKLYTVNVFWWKMLVLKLDKLHKMNFSTRILLLFFFCYLYLSHQMSHQKCTRNLADWTQFCCPAEQVAQNPTSCRIPFFAVVIYQYWQTFVTFLFSLSLYKVHLPFLAGFAV